MEVMHWMTRLVHTLKPLDSIAHAREMMERHRINQVPVVVDGHLVGIVTDRDVRDATPSVFDSGQHGRARRPAPAASDPAHIKVEEVMMSNVLSVGPQDSVENAAQIMRRERVGSVPVVEDGRIVGILTRSDVLEAFISLSEATKDLLVGELPRRVRQQ